MTDTTSGDSVILSPKERRERNREEMTAAILEIARAIMREEGVGGLNLNELARRVNMTTPALYGYFPSKSAIYDALYQLSVRLMRERDEAAWQAHSSEWERIRAWMETRLAFALECPELYHLVFGTPVPGFKPSDASAAEARKAVATTIRGLTEVIDAGAIAPHIPVERAVDLFLAVRHGIVAERVGKASVVSPDSGRFQDLIDDAIAVLQLAWSPGSVGSDGKGGETD